VLDYDGSIAFYDALVGWLGYSSFSSLNMEYQSIYYFTRYVNPHSYIGIQPALTGGKLTHSDQSVGINHVALWAKSRKEVDRFRSRLVRNNQSPENAHNLTRPSAVPTAPHRKPQARAPSFRAQAQTPVISARYRQIRFDTTSRPDR